MKGCFIGQELEFDAEEIIHSKIRLMINCGVTAFYSGRKNKFDELCEKSAKKLGAEVIFLPEYNIKDVAEICDAVLCNIYDDEFKELDDYSEPGKLIVNIAL